MKVSYTEEAIADIVEALAYGARESGPKSRAPSPEPKDYGFLNSTTRFVFVPF